MTCTGTLGIDAGTQGLSVVLVGDDLKVLATGDGAYEMVPGLDDGCYEQRPADWKSALVMAMQDLRSNLSELGYETFDVDAIGISGQMHGEVLIDRQGNSIGNTRLWCDARNQSEGSELTGLFGVKVPKRMTLARWLWTTRNQPDKAGQATSMTTPSGWIAFGLTGQANLGIGDASGMFPIDQSTLEYDSQMLRQLDSVDSNFGATVAEMLPAIRLAGQDAGSLNQQGAKLLGLPVGIPVAAAEGDQPAALAGSLIAQPGMVSVSFGTSVCANSVGDRPFEGVSECVDHFCAVDGRPINMVFLRNGTTFMNSIVEMFVDESANESQRDFGHLMKMVIGAPHDCDGVLALPFMDDEPGLGITESGKSGLFGLNSENAKPANVIKASLLATLFNLKTGMSILEEQGFPRTEIVLTGGLTKTPELGQIVADVMQTPVVLPSAADEGTAYGAALLAKYRLEVINGVEQSWAEFVRANQTAHAKKFVPDSDSGAAYSKVQQRYAKLVQQMTA